MVLNSSSAEDKLFRILWRPLEAVEDSSPTPRRVMIVYHDALVADAFEDVPSEEIGTNRRDTDGTIGPDGLRGHAWTNWLVD